MIRKTSVAIVVCAFLSSVPLAAHHGGNLYDTTKAKVMKGTITKFEWGTPHNQIFTMLRRTRAKVEHWVRITEPAGVMLERGVDAAAPSKPGDEVNGVHLRRQKTGATVGNLQKIVPRRRARKLTAGGPGPPTPDLAAAGRHSESLPHVSERVSICGREAPVGLCSFALVTALHADVRRAGSGILRTPPMNFPR
jgi:hypothetical protein